MVKKLFIFGNGLGRAISKEDNEFYSLERVLKLSWDNPEVVTDAQKQLICNCLDSNVIESDERIAPTKEDELSGLQRVLNACDSILEFEAFDTNNGVHWLTDHGREFPQSIRRYFHFAASQFHHHGKQLPETFSKSLRNYIRKNRPSIATLNYDDLLYECFTGTDIFTRPSKPPMLRDGFFLGRLIWSSTKRYVIQVKKDGSYICTVRRFS